jgi:hypothetical protein
MRNRSRDQWLNYIQFTKITVLKRPIENKVHGIPGNYAIKTNIILEDNILEQVSRFNYLECEVI